MRIWSGSHWDRTNTEPHNVIYSGLLFWLERGHANKWKFIQAYKDQFSKWKPASSLSWSFGHFWLYYAFKDILSSLLAMCFALNAVINTQKSLKKLAFKGDAFTWNQYISFFFCQSVLFNFVYNILGLAIQSLKTAELQVKGENGIREMKRNHAIVHLASCSLLLPCQKMCRALCQCIDPFLFVLFNDFLEKLHLSSLCASFSDCESEGMWGSIHLHHNSDVNLSCYHRNTAHDHALY